MISCLSWIPEVKKIVKGNHFYKIIKKIYVWFYDNIFTKGISTWKLIFLAKNLLYPVRTCLWPIYQGMAYTI